jgi:hypothetical protein
MEEYQVGADRIKNFKPDRTGSGWDDPVGRTRPDRIRITEKKFWIFREFRTGWPAPSLYWYYFWPQMFRQIIDRQVRENTINIYMNLWTPNHFGFLTTYLIRLIFISKNKYKYIWSLYLRLELKKKAWIESDKYNMRHRNAKLDCCTLSVTFWTLSVTFWTLSVTVWTLSVTVWTLQRFAAS